MKPRDLPDRRDPDVVEPPCRHVSDAPEPFDGQRVQEGELAVRRHREQTVRLGDSARHLGEELRPRDADRDRQADALADVAPQLRGDLGGRAREPLEPANVEEGLVDRQPFHGRGRVVEHPVDRLARLRVRRHARTDDDRIRTQPASLPQAHRSLDAARLRLVARGEHDASAHDHGAAAQPRVIPLLDRREERVDVGVEDRRLLPHEHMFA